MSVHEAKAVRRDLVECLRRQARAWTPAEDKVILGLSAYILNKGNVTPGFLVGLADDVAALAVRAHPQ